MRSVFKLLSKLTVTLTVTVAVTVALKVLPSTDHVYCCRERETQTRARKRLPAKRARFGALTLGKAVSCACHEPAQTHLALVP